MRRYRALGTLVPFYLVPFLLGSECSQQPQRAAPASAERPEPVLKADDDAKTIIAKAVKAHGGDKAFSCWKCGYLKYKAKSGVFPSRLGEVTMEDTFQLPGHFKRVARLDAGGKRSVMVFVVNDGKGWQKDGDRPAEPIDNDFTSKTEHPFAGHCNLAPVMDPQVRLTRLDDGRLNGRLAMRVRVHYAKLGEVDLYVDPKTGLVQRTRKSLSGADSDKPAMVESDLTDYKDVQGIKVPMRIKSVQDGKPLLDVTLIEVKFADKFEDGAFAKP